VGKRAVRALYFDLSIRNSLPSFVDNSQIYGRTGFRYIEAKVRQAAIGYNERFRFGHPDSIARGLNQVSAWGQPTQFKCAVGLWGCVYAQ
jgi:hypothetical protein